MFIKSVPGNTVEVLLWNHHLKENKLKRHVFLFKRFLLKTSWSIWHHIFICFLNNICSKKAWKDLCHQPCGEVSLSLVKSSLQNSLKIKINHFTFWLIIGCWTVCRWNCFSSECLSLVQTVCVVCLIIQWQETTAIHAALWVWWQKLWSFDVKKGKFNNTEGILSREYLPTSWQSFRQQSEREAFMSVTVFANTQLVFCCWKRIAGSQWVSVSLCLFCLPTLCEQSWVDQPKINTSQRLEDSHLYLRSWYHHVA